MYGIEVVYDIDDDTVSIDNINTKPGIFIFAKLVESFNY